MKNLKQFTFILIIMFAFSCKKENIIQKKSITPDNSPIITADKSITHTLYVDHITNSKGYWQDAPLSKLNTKDQSGTQDNWNKYIDFQPNSQRYQGYIYFYLPDDIDKSEVVEIKVKTNYKGRKYNSQKWYWKIRNFSTNKWVTLGKNTFAQDWKWSSNEWTKTSNNFIKSSNGEIRLMYKSNNANENSNLDYLVIEIKTQNQQTGTKLLEPSGTHIYHSAYTNFGGFEDEVSANKISNFENLANKDITWAYFSDNWFDGIHFPQSEVNIIHNAGKVPFIRIMPRNEDEDTPDPVYTMQAFIDGNFDAELEQWADNAKAVEYPLLIEFGTECNGDWFPWNAKWNGKNNKTGYGNPDKYDGAERFRDAYRHIIDIFNSRGVNNVTWFFHVNADNDPQVSWNKMKDYYPGDDYIDWIGLSVYGPQDTNDGWWSFENMLNDNWAEISSISNSGKPIAVLEMGVIDYPSLGNKSQWITDAYNAVGPNGTYAEDIDAMCWWHENFNDNGFNVNLKINSSNSAKNAYRNAVNNSLFISNASFSQ